MKANIYLATGFEEIEALSVVDVLRRAGINTKMISVTNALEVEGAHGITVIADVVFEDVANTEADMLILPGGMPGTNNLNSKLELKELILDFYRQEKWIAAICAAPLIFGQLGLLEDKNATCYPGFEHHLKGAKLSNPPVIVDGKIITAKGAGVAIDFALQIVDVLVGKTVAIELKNKMIVL